MKFNKICNAKPSGVFLPLLLSGLFLLTGCSGTYPDKAVDGTEWDKSWTILGTTLGVEEPGNGLTLSENPVVLTGNDISYATWTYGDPSDYTNSDGEDTDLYPAELYLVLYGCETSEYAESNVQDWIAKEEATYDVINKEQVSVNGQDYTILTYTVDSDDNPYSHGVSAFGVFENKGVSAEISCTEEAEIDDYQVLMDFLADCHYNSENTDK